MYTNDVPDTPEEHLCKYGHVYDYSKDALKENLIKCLIFGGLILVLSISYCCYKKQLEEIDRQQTSEDAQRIQDIEEGSE